MNIKKIKSVLRNRTKEIIKTKFRRRILKRQEIFWKKSNDLDKIKIKLSASSPMAEWKNLENWQRRLENKWNAKEFAKKFGCRVATLYWHGGKSDFLQFDLNQLPENYIIKPIMDHSSRNVFIMKKGTNLLNNVSYSNEELKGALLALYDTQPDLEFIIEEFISDDNGEFVVPRDYRFYMFNGNLAFIRLDERRSKEYDRVSFYTKDWKLIDKKILKMASTTQAVQAPRHLNQMIEDATKLSNAYKSFVRIDFYDSPYGPVFGEFTATPRGGSGFTRFGSKILIKEWDTHCKGLI